MKNLKSLLALAVALTFAPFVSAEEYEVGGPLEGPKLVLFPTQHGEKTGYPGCIPELINKGETTQDGGGITYREWDSQEQWPQYQLYPGSIENWRSYWGKYVPVRSMCDSGSLLKNWDATKIPGAEKAKVEQYTAPVYWTPRHATPKATGKFDAPVPVVRCGVKSPVFDLDLGELPIGMYVVRVIGAVETKKIDLHRKPLYAAMTVNDGNEGAESKYRLRLAFQDEFYSVAEFYFHAPAKRHYKARLWVDEGSTIELLVHNIDLHDVLAGTVRRAVKKQPTLTTPEERAQVRKEKGVDANAKTTIEDMAKRLEADEVLWNTLPPLNVQVGGIYGLNKGYGPKVAFGAQGKKLEQINEENGEWKIPKKLDQTLIVNEKLKLTYTMADLAALKPLPDPYPFKDTGAGLVTLASASIATQQEFTVIADAVAKRFMPYYHNMRENAQRYHETGDIEAGWTAAIELCRTAWQFPSLDGTQTLGGIVTDPGGFERDMRCRRRDPSIAIGPGNGMSLVDLPELYDRVFDVIKGNEALAKSVGRFIPWVKTSDDVVQLVDVYFMQIMAKQIIRYNHMYDNAPTMISDPAAVLGDRSVTDPWLAWVFAKAYIYPNPPAGLGEVIVTGNGREGTGYIGSWNYSVGEQTAKNGEALDWYLRAGGNPNYDVTNPRTFPKVSEAAYWMAFRTRLAGLHIPRIGDVCGPDKEYGSMFDSCIAVARSGWQWTHDPAFAFIVKHYLGRQHESEKEWSEIEQAAAKQKRAPWLENHSRVMPSWCGVLEGGTQYDDFRFRRSVMLRIGMGYGHAHADTLDMQITAHGLPMTIDGGQRPGYSKPGDATTRIHNLVEVDGKDWVGHAWIRSLSDAEGARYMLAEAVPPANHSNVKSYRRQVAMIDVDEGSGAKPLTPEQLKPRAPLDKGVVTPNSYVFDVVRVSGGKMHTYCFHAALEDELVTNVEDKKPYEKLSDDEQEYLKIFRNEPIQGYPMEPQRYGGKAPDVFEATWRLATDIPGVGLGEKEMASSIYDPAGPRKYTRLHLFGQRGARVMTGWAWCRQWKYGYNTLMTQRRSETETEVVFPAIIEPYAGKPFIAERRLLGISGNETDASRAVAVEIKTTNGHTDVVFSDDRPEKIRKVGDMTVAGEFAYISRDKDGLRQASLTGGTQLNTGDVSIQLPKRELTATISKAGYFDRQVVIDQEWATTPLLKDSVVQIGVPGRMTTYVLAGGEASKGQSTLKTVGGADMFLSRVTSVNAEMRTVNCTLAMPQLAGERVAGLDKQLVASNAEGTKFWRANYVGKVGDGKQAGYQLDGAVSEDDFGKSGGLRLWEYGVGDTVRLATFASVRRVGDKTYELTANADVIVALKGSSMEISTDGRDWKPAQIKRDGGKLSLAVGALQLNNAGKIWLRVQ